MRHSVLPSVTLLALALGAIAGGLALAEPPTPGLLSPAAQFGVAAGLVALANLARFRVRIGADTVSVTWTEAALIVALYLAPAGWLPAATFVGAGVAWTLLSLFAERRAPIDVVETASGFTIAVALGAAVTSALTDPYGAAPSPATAGAATAGAVTYVVASAGVVALTLSLRRRASFWTVLVRVVQSKALMVVGNVLIGIVAVVILADDPQWLLFLPAALWLLQQTYGLRLLADDERRAWQEFARATGALNQLDERAVATAGATGALAIFGADQVEIDVVRADGRRRRYTADRNGVLREDDTAPPRPRPDDQTLTRTLTVGDAEVGELRVRLPRSVLPGPRERNALNAFGDTLGAALHDAATHRALLAMTARSSYEARHDPLTRLVNRSALLSQGDATLRDLPPEHPVALILLDLNDFREVNDILGHAAGDELLRATAERLAGLVRPGELLGRLGGDEFALLATALPVIADSEGGAPIPSALRRAREIIKGLASAPIEVAGIRMSVEASVGVVVANAGAADMTELLRRADIAMYQAKNAGAGVALYDSAYDASSTDQLALLAELREALATDDQLILALQPLVDLTTGEPTGVEALIRWQHPRRGWLNPSEFIGAVEGSELLAPFTRYVIDKALAVAAEWARHGLDVPISVNVSARNLLDPRLPNTVASLLRRHHVPPNRLILEITETVAMSDLDVIDEVLGSLREMGVRIAVDDFGTGFSSLSFLTRISVDELKVDRSFVGQMVESPQAAAIVRTTIELGRQLGLRVIAEGVETADQRAALVDLGCAAAQGYHFFKPVPADRIVGVLRSLLDTARAQVLPLRADGAS